MNALSVGRKLKIESWTSSAVWPYLQLTRPPNLVTAAADILAGYAVAGATELNALFWLLAATIGLYGGGVVFNDYFDARLDAVERPERPIPSGRVPVRRAALLGALLLIAGVAAGFRVSPAGGLIALAISLSALAYDAWGKKQPIVGSIGVGLCRGLNFLLGMSAAPWLIGRHWTLSLIAFFYITAITVLSKGEVHGGEKGRCRAACGLLGLAVLILLLQTSGPDFETAALLPFLILLLIRVAPPFRRAALKADAASIRTAVRAGVLSLIVLDAAIAAAHAGFFYGLALLSLSALAGRMARLFAVT